MKNNSKRIYALLLAVVMCFTCVVPVFAESSDAHVHSEAEAAKCPGAGKEHTTTNCDYTFVETVPAKCGEWGYDLNRCKTCNAPVLTNWTKLEGSEDHDFGDWTVITPSTCYEYGVMEKVCGRENCGHKVTVAPKSAAEYDVALALYGEAVAAINLRAHDLKNDKPEGLTCRDTAKWNVWCGYEDCSYGKLESGEVDLAWNEGIDGEVNGTDCIREVVEVTVRPTCDDKGVATVKCTVCGDIDYEVEVEVTNGGAHEWIKHPSIDFTVAPTCATAASGVAICKYCQQTAEVKAGNIEVVVTPVDGEAEPTIIYIPVADFAALPHVFDGEISKQKDPTCIDTGLLPHYTCTNGDCTAVSLDGVVACDASEIVIPVIPHKWGELVEKVDYTCTKDGMKAHMVCDACGYYLDVEATKAAGKEVVYETNAKLVLAARHEFDVELDENGKPSKDDALAWSEPSCTKFGFWFYGCSVCGELPENKGESYDLAEDEAGWIREGVWRLPKLPHPYKETVVDQTCTVDGVVEKVCPICGDKPEPEVAPAPGHNWKEVVFGGTCQVKAHSYDVCINENCGAIRVETEETTESGRPTTDKNGWYNIGEKNFDNHEWDEKKQVISTAPTCTAPGQSLDYCPFCSVYEENEIPALGHNSLMFVEIIPATCDQDGKLVYKCNDCQNKTTEVQLDPDQLTEAHEKYAENSVLDLSKLGHSIAGVTPAHTNPTCTTPGYDTYKCVRYGQGGCSHTVKVVLDDNDNVLYPAYNHKYDNGDSAKYLVPTLPKCEKSETELKGIDGYVTEKCYRCDYSQKVADIKFNWNNPEHHPGSAINPNTVYHNGVKYESAEAADIAAGGEANGLYRIGNCEKSQLTDYYCSNCEKTFFAEDDTMVGAHVEGPAHKDAVPATCTETGLYEHYICAVCKNTVRVVGEKHEIYEKDSDLVSPALGHDWELVEGFDPDCVTEGAKDYYDCSRCDLYTLNPLAKSEDTFSIDDLAGEIYIAPDEHVFGAIVPKVEPGCETTGFEAYYECSVCENKFLTNEDKLSVDYKSDLELTIPKLGHTPDYGYASEADCVTEGYVYIHCVTCDKEVVADYVYPWGHNFSDLVAKVEPDCDSTGFEAYYECLTCGEKFISNENIFSNDDLRTDAQLTIPATGEHKNAAGEDIRNACTDATEDRFCVGCQSEIAMDHTEYKTNYVNATCTEYGYWAWECLACKKFGRVAGSEVDEPTNPDHENLDVPYYCYWDYTTNAPTMYEAGEYYLRCNVCDEILDTEEVPAIGGIEFTFEIDNAIYSGAEYVNGGQIKLTISYKAANVDVANIMLRLDYNKSVLDFVDGDFECDAFDINNASIGGNEDGTLIISAKTTGFGEEVTNINLNGEGVFAVIYFNIDKAAPAGSSFDFEVIKSGDSATKVLSAGEKDDAGRITYDEIPAIYGSIVADDTKLLADIDIDGTFGNADEVEFLDIAFSNGYIAAADINQDGFIGLDDYDYLYDLILKNITYEELCEAAQA